MKEREEMGLDEGLRPQCPTLVALLTNGATGRAGCVQGLPRPQGDDRELAVRLGALVSVRPRQQRVTEFISPETNVISVRGGEVLSLHPRGICGCPSFGVQNLGLAVAVKASRSLGCRLPRSFTGVETALRMHKDVAIDGRRDVNSDSRSQFVCLVVPCRLPPRLDVVFQKGIRG